MSTVQLRARPVQTTSEIRDSTLQGLERSQGPGIVELVGCCTVRSQRIPASSSPFAEIASLKDDNDFHRVMLIVDLNE